MTTTEKALLCRTHRSTNNDGPLVRCDYARAVDALDRCDQWPGVIRFLSADEVSLYEQGPIAGMDLDARKLGQ